MLQGCWSTCATECGTALSAAPTIHKWYSMTSLTSLTAWSSTVFTDDAHPYYCPRYRQQCIVSHVTSPPTPYNSQTAALILMYSSINFSILTSCKSSLNFEVIGQRSRSHEFGCARARVCVIPWLSQAVLRWSWAKLGDLVIVIMNLIVMAQASWSLVQRQYCNLCKKNCSVYIGYSVRVTSWL